MIRSIDLAWYLINKELPDLNHLKLQKLLYYIQAWHLVFRCEKLFNDDFEAWVHGPVSREVWDYFSDHSIIYKNIPPNHKKNIDLNKLLDEEQIQIINDVIDEYGDKTPYYLERLTHSEEPWVNARKGLSPIERSKNIINIGLIKSYYEQLLNEQI